MVWRAGSRYRLELYLIALLDDSETQQPSNCSQCIREANAKWREEMLDLVQAFNCGIKLAALGLICCEMLQQNPFASDNKASS